MVALAGFALSLVVVVLTLSTSAIRSTSDVVPSGASEFESKPGVNWSGAQPVLIDGLRRARAAVELAGLGPFVVTSVTDGVHLPNSFHYRGRAADLRTRHLAAERWESYRETVARALGPGWDVILEDDHVHAEWDPHAGSGGVA